MFAFLGSIFASKLGKPLEYLLAIGAVLVLVFLVIRWHDDKIIAQVQDQYKVVAAAAQVHQAQMINSALQTVQTDTIHRLTTLSQTNRLIDAAPVIQGCVQSPAVRAALDSLHPDSPRGGSAAAGSRQSLDLQAAARLVERGHGH